MKYHNKMAWAPLDSPIIPKLEMQIAEVNCHRCGNMTLVPVKPEYVDWKDVAEMYRRCLEDAYLHFDRIVADIDLLVEEKNPVREYLKNEWEETIGRLRRMIEEQKENHNE